MNRYSAFVGMVRDGARRLDKSLRRNEAGWVVQLAMKIEPKTIPRDVEGAAARFVMLAYSALERKPF